MGPVAAARRAEMFGFVPPPRTAAGCPQVAPSGSASSSSEQAESGLPGDDPGAGTRVVVDEIWFSAQD
jgi:hypothetical protein